MLDLAAIKEAEYYQFPSLKSPAEIQAFLLETKLHRKFRSSWRARNTRFLVDSGCSDTLVGAKVVIDNEIPSSAAINTANGVTRASSSGDYTVFVKGEEKCVLEAGNIISCATCGCRVFDKLY